MNILIMTLGKGRKEAGHRYQKTKYRFEDGTVRETSFFGQALQDWFSTAGKRMDKVIILGTDGSSWDALLESATCCREGMDEFYVELGEAVANGRVAVDLLESLGPVVSEILNAETVCRLIPDASTAAGQFDILSIIAGEIPEQAHLWMDLTHGFRHLPLLELFSALNLEETKGVCIEGLYYGMFEKSVKDSTPVVELSFARELNRWTRALYALERGQLSALIGLPGMESLTDHLERLVLYEQLNRTDKARSAAQQLLHILRAKPLSSRAGELCRSRLVEHFQWSEERTYCHRQFRSAEKAIWQRDYVHSIILLNETLITHALPNNADPLNYEERKIAIETYCTTDDHYRLRDLRNMLAHGTRPSGRNTADIMAMIDDPGRFHKEMLRLIEVVKKQIGLNDGEK
jgi:CRISPR-associated Csx2 family protein